MSKLDAENSLLAKPRGSEALACFADDARLSESFGPIAREVEETIELYFSDLAAASDTYSGELFDDETHASFYLASREVISQGLRSQLEFLRDNAPRAFALLVGRSAELANRKE